MSIPIPNETSRTKNIVAKRAIPAPGGRNNADYTNLYKKLVRLLSRLLGKGAAGVGWKKCMLWRFTIAKSPSTC
jgi:hypothetical protein